LQIAEEIRYVDAVTANPATTFSPTVPAPAPTNYPTLGTLAPTPPTVPTKQPTYVPTYTLAEYAQLGGSSPPSVAAAPASASAPTPSVSQPSAPTASDGDSATTASTAEIAGLGVLGAVAGVAALGVAARVLRRGSVSQSGGSQPVRVPRQMSRHGDLAVAPPLTAGVAYGTPVRNPAFRSVQV